MKKLIIVMVILFAYVQIFGNGGAFYNSGDSIFPIDDNSVSLKEEILYFKQIKNNHSFNLFKSKNMEFEDPYFNQGFDVTAQYSLYNSKKEKKMTIGFILPPPFDGGHIDVTKYNDSVRYMNIVFNNEAIPYKYKFQENGYENTYLKSQNKRNECIYYFEVIMKKGYNSLKVNYYIIGGEEMVLGFGFSYRLITALLWQNHKIDMFTLFIDIGQNKSFTISIDDSDKGTWNIIGIGNRKKYNDNSSNTFFIKNGLVTFNIKNFIPKNDLSIDGITDGYHYLDIDSNKYKYNNQSLNPDFFSFFLNLIPFLNNPSEATMPDITDLNKLTNLELRLLRNMFYGYHGYIFDDNSLQKFFEQFIWYIKDPNLTSDNINFSQIEKDLIELILKTENDK